MKNIQKISSILFVAACLLACDKWEPLPEIDTNGLVDKVENEANETILKYEYHSNGTLKSSWEYKPFYTQDKKSTFTYEFNSDGQLVSAKGFVPGNIVMSSIAGAADSEVEYTYQYKSDGLVSEIRKEYHYEEYPEVDHYILLNFEYPEKLKTIVTSSYKREDEILTTGRTEYYFNNKRNIEKIKYYSDVDGEELLNSETELTYDSKNTPFTFDPYPRSANNITERKSTVYYYNESGNRYIAYSNTDYFDYEYNNNGYPLKSTETYPSGHVNINYYFYKK
jgi:hypothetical protein